MTKLSDQTRAFVESQMAAKEDEKEPSDMPPGIKGPEWHHNQLHLSAKDLATVLRVDLEHHAKVLERDNLRLRREKRALERDLAVAVALQKFEQDYRKMHDEEIRFSKLYNRSAVRAKELRDQLGSAYKIDASRMEYDDQTGLITVDGTAIEKAGG